MIEINRCLPSPLLFVLVQLRNTFFSGLLRGHTNEAKHVQLSGEGWLLEE
jgi:hypothetical protein